MWINRFLVPFHQFAYGLALGVLEAGRLFPLGSLGFLLGPCKFQGVERILDESVPELWVKALMGTAYDAGLRVTFDTALTYHIPPFQLHAMRSGLLMLPANRVVMEIKVNDRIPTWLVNLIAEHNMHLQRISKYCTSIEASWSNPLFLRRGTLSENSKEILLTTHSVFNQENSKIKVSRRPKSGE